MYKNFSLTDKERKQILEMHQSKGYKKPMNEDLDDAEEFERESLNNDNEYGDDRTEEEKSFDDKKESLLNAILKISQQLDAMDVNMDDIETYLIDRSAKLNDDFFKRNKYVVDSSGYRPTQTKVGPKEKLYKDLPNRFNKQTFNKETGKSEYN